MKYLNFQVALKRCLDVNNMFINPALVIETLIQLFAVIFLSPLFIGISNKLKSKIESKQGPSIFQPYYDLIKLLQKESVIPFNAKDIFIYVPYLAFGIYCLIAIVIPVILPQPIYFTATVDFLGGALLFGLAGFIKIIASMDSGNNFSALGAARVASFGVFAEGTLILVFFAIALITSTNNPYITNNYLVAHPGTYLTLIHVFGTISFLMLFIFESGRLPVESSGLMEFGMVDDALSYEYSGKLLAINKWGSWIKQYLLGSVLINVFLIPWGLQTGIFGALADIPIMIFKWIILIVILVIIETSLAKMRLFKIQDYLSIAFSISLFFLILNLVIA